MKDEQRIFLSVWGQAPARLNVEQTAWALNFQVHDIPILTRAGHLKPLGNPVSNATKYFSSQTVLEHAKDPVWLAKATNAIAKHWQRKNRTENGAMAST